MSMLRESHSDPESVTLKICIYGNIPTNSPF